MSERHDLQLKYTTLLLTMGLSMLKERDGSSWSQVPSGGRESYAARHAGDQTVSLRIPYLARVVLLYWCTLAKMYALAGVSVVRVEYCRVFYFQYERRDEYLRVARVA